MRWHPPATVALGPGRPHGRTHATPYDCGPAGRRRLPDRRRLARDDRRRVPARPGPGPVCRRSLLAGQPRGVGHVRRRDAAGTVTIPRGATGSARQEAEELWRLMEVTR